MKTIKGKVTMLCVLVCAMTGLVFSVLSLRQNKKHMIENKVKEQESYVNVYASEIQSRIEDLKKDVRFLSSTPPIKGILRATLNGGIDKEGHSSLDQWKQRLATIFSEMLYSQNRYLQLRYIGVNDGGRELVRVERRDLKVEVTSESDLQQKGEEEYFKEALKANPGGVYLSKFSLNKEYGKVVFPLQMVLRAAVPIYQKAGEVFGIIIINVDYSELFKKFAFLEDKDSEFFVSSHENKILVSSVDSLDALFVDMQAPRLKFFSKILGEAEVRHLSEDSVFQYKLDENIIVGKNIRYNKLNPLDSLKIFLILNEDQISFQVRQDLYLNLLLTLALVVLAIGIAYFFSNRVVSPIQKLMTLTKELSAGRLVKKEDFIVDTDDEIGQLTKTFIEMSGDIFKKNNIMAAQQKALDCSAIVAETDLQGRITYVNDKFIEISKYSESELMGQDHRMLNSGHHPKSFFVGLWKTISTGRVWKGEIKNRAKDGNFYWVDTTIYPFKDENGELQKFVAIRFDITSRKDIEEKLILTTNEAQKTAQFKAQFLANMSHEIRTPLNTVIGLSDVLMEGKLNTEQMRYVTGLREAGDSLLGLVNEILDLSKIESGHLQIENIQFSIEQVAYQVADMVSIKAHSKKLELVVRYDHKVPSEVYGDELRVKQILINLLGNAVKFTNKGKVELNLGLEKLYEDNVLISIEVKDTGVGIEEKSLESIFNSFTQADSSITRKFGGTGLGLNIVKQITNRLDGKISVESQVGRGSCFKVILPFKVNTSCLLKRSNLLEKVSNKKVLIIDHHEATRKEAENILLNMGFIVDHAPTLNEGLEKITGANSYDLVVIDAHVSNQSSIVVIQKLQLKNISPDQTILTVSARSSNFDFHSYKEKGYNWVVSKPLNRIKLEDMMRKALAIETKGNLLIVEDDVSLIESMQENLSHLDLDVSVAQSVEEALKAIKMKKFDLIVSDLKLPGESGIDFCSRLRSKNQNLPFIISSAFIDKDIRERGAQLEVTDFLEKPYSKSMLLESVRKGLANGLSESRLIQAELNHTGGDNTTILIVDDSFDNRELMNIYFKNESFKVVYAEDGQEAVDLFKTQKFDIVFMDMQMPIMDGYEATQVIREWELEKGLIQTPILALTANAMREEREKTLGVGCTAYLSKPIKKKTLLKIIEQYTKQNAA